MLITYRLDGFKMDKVTTKQTGAAQTRERLVNAAIQSVRTGGISALTLDGVAREANVSKGGLLHHFKSKDALIEAILQHLFIHFEERVASFLEGEEQRAGRWMRAYIRATFEDEPLPLELIILLASALEDRALLKLIQADFIRWHERLLADGLPIPRATIIRQATDAYWTERLLGLGPRNEDERLLIRDELLRLTEAG
ncbi:MAG: TetR family transcriptional regulator [Anaerolineae bacterium]|nr:TetR family transcriptional regulator [Anaerolineae bacterium]